jgi:hypothetical protein
VTSRLVRTAGIVANRALPSDGDSARCAQLTTWIDGTHPVAGRVDDARATGQALLAHLHHSLQGGEPGFADRPLMLDS